MYNKIENQLDEKQYLYKILHQYDERATKPKLDKESPQTKLIFAKINTVFQSPKSFIQPQRTKIKFNRTASAGRNRKEKENHEKLINLNKEIKEIVQKEKKEWQKDEIFINEDAIQLTKIDQLLCRNDLLKSKLKEMTEKYITDLSKKEKEILELRGYRDYYDSLNKKYEILMKKKKKKSVDYENETLQKELSNIKFENKRLNEENNWLNKRLKIEENEKNILIETINSLKEENENLIKNNKLKNNKIIIEHEKIDNPTYILNKKSEEINQNKTIDPVLMNKDRKKKLISKKQSFAINQQNPVIYQKRNKSIGEEIDSNEIKKLDDLLKKNENKEKNYIKNSNDKLIIEKKEKTQESKTNNLDIPETDENTKILEEYFNEFVDKCILKYNESNISKIKDQETNLTEYFDSLENKCILIHEESEKINLQKIEKEVKTYIKNLSENAMIELTKEKLSEKKIIENLSSFNNNKNNSNISKMKNISIEEINSDSNKKLEKLENRLKNSEKQFKNEMEQIETTNKRDSLSLNSENIHSKKKLEFDIVGNNKINEKNKLNKMNTSLSEIEKEIILSQEKINFSPIEKDKKNFVIKSDFNIEPLSSCVRIESEKKIENKINSIKKLDSNKEIFENFSQKDLNEDKNLNKSSEKLILKNSEEKNELNNICNSNVPINVIPEDYSNDEKEFNEEITNSINNLNNESNKDHESKEPEPIQNKSKKKNLENITKMSLNFNNKVINNKLNRKFHSFEKTNLINLPKISSKTSNEFIKSLLNKIINKTFENIESKNIIEKILCEIIEIVLSQIKDKLFDPLKIENQILENFSFIDQNLNEILEEKINSKKIIGSIENTHKQFLNNRYEDQEINNNEMTRTGEFKETNKKIVVLALDIGNPDTNYFDFIEDLTNFEIIINKNPDISLIEKEIFSKNTIIYMKIPFFDQSLLSKININVLLLNNNGEELYFHPIFKDIKVFINEEIDNFKSSYIT